jgi:hypothetical protein
LWRLQYSILKNRSSRQEFNKETSELIDIIDQIGITDICRVFHILLSNPWNLLQNRSYFRTQKSLSKCKKVEITPCILSNHNGIKLELKSKRNYRKFQMYGTKEFIVE